MGYWICKEAGKSQEGYGIQRTEILISQGFYAS